MEARNVQGINVRLSKNPLVWVAQIEDLVEKACENSENTFSPKTVFQSILDGSFDLWIVHDDEEVLGFYVTEILFIDAGLVVNVPFAGFRKNLKALVVAFDHAERVAEASGAVGFKFISKDKRWETLARRRGFRPRFVEYYKEFK
jgi:hypothetical protein